MDKEALNLARRWNTQQIKHWYAVNWYALIEGLERLSVLFVIIFRLILSPLLLIAYLIGVYLDYRQLLSYSEKSREQVRRKIERLEKK